MRRIAVIAACVLAIVGLTPQALADSTLTVKGFNYDSSTSHWPGLDATPCGGTNVVGNYNNYLDIVAGSSTWPLDNAAGAPTTTRSWEISYPSTPSPANAYGAAVYPSAASDFQTFKIDVNGSTSGQSSIYAYNLHNFWAGKVAVTAPGTGWSTVDASNLTYTWYEYNYGTGPSSPPTLITTTPYTGTAAQFEATYGKPGYGYSADIGFGCDGNAFTFQNLQWGATGSVTTDIFSTLKDPLMIARSTSKIVAGSSVTIRGGLKFAYGDTVKLQARPATSSTWSTVTTLPMPTGAPSCTTTSGNFICWHRFSKATSPKVTTAYRWYETGNVASDPSYSSTTTVSVATRIRATWPSTIYHGSTFSVTGTTYPAKPGSVVTLYGKHGTTTYKLGHATVDRYGKFHVYGKVGSRGTWSFWITIPAVSGDLAGKSGVKSEYVR
ncbi:MAG: hypothetical protein ACTHJM_13945 [Marmoricola sp.]